VRGVVGYARAEVDKGDGAEDKGAERIECSYMRQMLENTDCRWCCCSDLRSRTAQEGGEARHITGCQRICCEQRTSKERHGFGTLGFLRLKSMGPRAQRLAMVVRRLSDIDDSVERGSS